MTSLESVLRMVSTDLAESGVAFALVGGLAVSVRTEPRFTRDADLAVALADDAEAEALVNRLQGCGYRVATVLEHAAGRLSTVRLQRSTDAQAPVVDLLFASSGIEAEIVAQAEHIEILPSLRIGVARTGHLIALKLLSRDDVERPQDLVDLRALVRAASRSELDRARESIALITERGYDRGRRLAAALAGLLVR